PFALGLCKYQLHLCPSHSIHLSATTPGQLLLFLHGGCDHVQSRPPAKAPGGHFSCILFVLVFLIFGISGRVFLGFLLLVFGYVFSYITTLASSIGFGDSFGTMCCLTHTRGS